MGVEADREGQSDEQEHRKFEDSIVISNLSVEERLDDASIEANRIILCRQRGLTTRALKSIGSSFVDEAARQREQ
ncbi:hypothetical protein KFK09_010076 [Dendrobium nobile]|uniref:Uncharacterized protein n=1 Tax=Dendrobium nobile TaxID=94219 RepID=A0A8T3BL56_DENNO|nr:hypothetical protein KFK09_010076 [Dendrobium nobile]